MQVNTKRAKSIIAVFAIVLAVYVLLFFVIPFPKKTASYISFAFTVISFIACFAITFFAFKDDRMPASKLYGFPIFRVGILYAVIQCSCGIVVLIVAAFVAVSAWIPISIGVILLAAAAVGVIATDSARDHVTQLDQNTRETTKTATSFRINMKGIVDQCGSAEYKKELERLSESFRFSDPVSSDATKAIEDDLQNMIDRLKSLMTENDTDTIKSYIRQIENKLNERNRVCKANKH